jgi:rhodanese-related sulfurtransferase
LIARLMGLPTIGPRDLLVRVEAGSVTVVDVNPRASWLSARVPGALHGAALPEDRDTAIVFYCSGPLCRKAPNAAKQARALGYRDVRVLSAGIAGWLGARLPTESGPA